MRMRPAARQRNVHPGVSPSPRRAPPAGPLLPRMTGREASADADNGFSEAAAMFELARGDYLPLTRARCDWWGGGSGGCELLAAEETYGFR